MVLLTLIARVIDGLPLAASMEDEKTDRALAEYKTQAKMLFKRLSPSSPTRCTLETQGSYVFHYAIEKDVCYLVLCDKMYPKKLAFAFLDELQREFDTRYASEVGTAARPYAFIAFDVFIQKCKRSYSDSRAQRNLSKLNEELVDVQKIMMKNIEDVLGRGEKLDSIGSKASNLSEQSKRYLKDAKYLSWQAFVQQFGPIGAVVVIVLLFLYFYYWY